MKEFMFKAMTNQQSGSPANDMDHKGVEKNGNHLNIDMYFHKKNVLLSESHFRSKPD